MTLLVTDSQLNNHTLMENINSFLKFGEIPNLFDHEDKK